MKKPTISLPKGRIQGEWISKGKLASFKGIPYAQAPVGELRWKSPQPFPKWEGVRIATKYSPFAWQQEISLPLFLNALIEGQGWNKLRKFFIKALLKIAPKPRQSEDCLYLNIKTPTLAEDSKLPVMVWIHGGDHQDGSAADIYYDGKAIPEKGIVLVTINYRLGLMGYFAHPELKKETSEGIAGNYGTLDQIAALKWVQENIAFFGGDPDNVTIFGESAGGESVLHMLSSPLAKGLFHKAILQSAGNAGQFTHQSKAFEYIQSAEETSLQFATIMGVKGENQIDQLRKIPAKDLMERLRKEEKVNAFYPNIDGYVLPKSPVETFRDNEQTKVPILLGSNSDEGTCIYPIFEMPIIEYRHLDLSGEQLFEQLENDFGEDLEQLYQLYPGLEQGEEQAKIALLGDDFFGAKARYYAECAANCGQQVFLYLFKRTPPSPKQTAGAFHAAELPFVHGTNTPILPLNEADKSLSQKMINYWTNFAKTGNPNHENCPNWDTFESNNPKWMVLDINKMGMDQIDRDEAYQLLIKRTLSRLKE